MRSALFFALKKGLPDMIGAVMMIGAAIFSVTERVKTKT